MPASKVGVRVRFRVDHAREIAAKHGWTIDHEVAGFFGVTQSNFSRIATGQSWAGDKFIAAVLTSNPGNPEITFDALFEVVAA